jgi:hypothetical protein
VVEETQEESQWGGVGQLTLTYKGETDTANVSLKHDLSPEGRRFGPSNRTSLTFGFSKRLTYELSATLAGGYFINRALPGRFSSDRTDEDSMFIAPGIRYQFNNDTAVDFSYTYNKVIYNLTRDTADRNVFRLNFRIQHELFK